MQSIRILTGPPTGIIQFHSIYLFVQLELIRFTGLIIQRINNFQKEKENNR